MHLFKYRYCFLLFMLFVSLQISAQSDAAQKKTDQQQRMKMLIESKKYRFHALSATSQRGKTIQLNSEYFLRIDNDSLRVDLPYYGRSFTSDYPATDLSIRFDTNQFTYAADSAKKGGWQINIQPKNQSKANKIYMSVSENGYCTLQVTSNTRTPVSYYGTIEEY